ncbi:RNA-directed DNA polymerase, eukaryota [Tanacetum coccineum]
MVHTPIDSESIPVRVSEVDGEIDSLFNGYTLTSSIFGGSNDDIEDGDDSDEDSDVNREEEDGPLGATNEDILLEKVGVSRNSDSGPHIHSKEGSTSNSRKQDKPNFLHDCDTTVHVCDTQGKSSMPYLFQNVPHETLPTPHTHMKKRYDSLRLIDPLNGIAPLHMKKKAATSTFLNLKPGKYSQPPKPSSSSCPDAINKTMEVGKALGFNLVGKEKDVPQALVYALQALNRKKKLWLDIETLVQSQNCLSVVMGDFNEVRHENERLGSHFCRRSALVFNDFILSTGLLDLPMGAAAIELRGKIEEIDRMAELSPLSATDVDVRIKKVQLLAKIEHRKLKDLRQKAKMKWALKGDENSSFFHGIINNRRNHSRINGFAIEGEWVTDPVPIKSHILHFFEAKFKEPSHNRPSFSSNLFKQLTPDENLILESPISSQEIKNAVWDCDGEKAPGPDRPISLIGCQYKIIAKVLANRLSLVIPSVVGDVQMAFIKGRQITDGPLLVNEIISWAKKHRKKLLLLKIDFEKAFDSLSWSFLESIMAQMRFGEKWRNWIHSCLNSAFASVLINGSPTSEFKLERGLRQGDPLSPFLFILAVKALNVVFLEARNKNIFLGAEVGRDKVLISHLQFTDDALIVGHWSLPNAKNLSVILTCFQLASGLKVNFSKSKLFGIRVLPSELNSLASSIGCQPSLLPCT